MRLELPSGYYYRILGSGKPSRSELRNAVEGLRALGWPIRRYSVYWVGRWT